MTRMLPGLENLDPITRLGFLARTALAISSSPHNPDAAPALPNEMELREKVLAHLRTQLGLSHDDDSPSARERIGDELDAESDQLVSVDEEGAIRRLSDKGLLASDQLEIKFEEAHVRQVWGNSFKRECNLAKKTICRPDREEQFGPAGDKPIPDMVSIFARWEKTGKTPFLHFVDGWRAGGIFHVTNIWRIYADDVSLEPVGTLVDVMRKFSEIFGHPIRIGRHVGKFIESARVKRGENVQLSCERLPGEGVYSGFRRFLGDEEEFVFASAIDLVRYKASMRRHGA